MAQESRFSQLYRQRTQEGGGTFSSIGTAASQRLREQADLRRLFPKTGMLGAMLQSAFGKSYSATGKRSPGDSRTASSAMYDSKTMSVIRINTATMAKNSMVLPGMARDMNVMRQNITRLTKHTTGNAATRADAQFLKSKERESMYESSLGKTSPEKKSTMGKAAGGAGSIFKSMFGGLGSILGGTLALGGWAVSSLVSGLGSVLGIAGGIAGGILGAIGSAVSGLGIMGIIALAGAGFLISKMSKSGMFDNIGSLFGIKPAADGKGLFEDTAIRLDKFFSTDKFTETLHQIKGTFAGLAAASLKVFENLSGMMQNFLNLAFQEMKILLVELTNKIGAVAGGALGAKAGFNVGSQIATSAMALSMLTPVGAARGAGVGLLKMAFKGAGLTAGTTALGGALGYFGGKSLSENIESSLGSEDISTRQKSLLDVINTDPVVKNAFEKYVQVRRAQSSGVDASWTFDDEVLGMSSKYTANSNKEAIDFLNRKIAENSKGKKPKLEDLEKEFGIAFGAPITTDESFTMMAMKHKRKHLQSLFSNNLDITSGVSDAFSEAKSQYTSPTKVGGNATFRDLTKEQQDALLMAQREQEGFKPGTVSYDLNNPGNLVYSEQTARFGAKRDLSGRGVGDVKGKFAVFPSLEAGIAAQKDLWMSSGYADKPLDEALKRWTGTMDKPEVSANYRKNIFAKLSIENNEAINKNTDAVIGLKETMQEQDKTTTTELLSALLQAMASTTTGTNVTTVNNTSVSSGGMASPYNDDLLSLFKSRAAQGF